MTKFNSGIFHTYDIRGEYPEEVNPEAAYRVGRAFAKYLKIDRKKTLPFSVAVGLDMRVSSPFLARELIRGITDQGIDVVDVGIVSISALYYTVAFKDLSGGVMVTASHMPKQYNGFKICLEKAFSVGRETGLFEIKKYYLDESQDPQTAKGKVVTWEKMTQEYVAKDLSYVDCSKIKKFRIAADPGNCMGAAYLEEFFKLVPCEPVKINWELNGNMPIHEANPLKLETLQQLQEIIRNEKADLGIATDGDGDRISFLDEQGTPIPTDIIGGIVMTQLLQEHLGETMVYDLRYSRGVLEKIREAGGKLVESRVGYVFIKALMQKHNAIFGGELSGHFNYRENFGYESPVFVAAQILLAMSRQSRPFSEIWRPFQTYFHSGEINFEVTDKKRVLDKLEQKYGDGKIGKLDGVTVSYPEWWFNLRPSANDPVLRLTLEARTEEQMKQKVEEVRNIIETN